MNTLYNKFVEGTGKLRDIPLLLFRLILAVGFYEPVMMKVKNLSGVAEWFGLKRPNFILDPNKDADFYAPRTGVDIPKLIEGIQVNLVTERPPKRFFWGIYGGGKTHTLFHISRQLEKLLDIYPVYVECPSVPKKSTFIHLYHDGIMASMGQDFVLEMFKDL